VRHWRLAARSVINSLLHGELMLMARNQYSHHAKTARPRNLDAFAVNHWANVTGLAASDAARPRQYASQQDRSRS
jgi:hypothetical protein